MAECGKAKTYLQLPNAGGVGRGERACFLPSSSDPLPPGVTCSPDVSQVSICSLTIREQLSLAC